MLRINNPLDLFGIYAGSWHDGKPDDQTHEPASMEPNKLEYGRVNGGSFAPTLASNQLRHQTRKRKYGIH
jgi:hypothetical protein